MCVCLCVLAFSFNYFLAGRLLSFPFLFDVADQKTDTLARLLAFSRSCVCVFAVVLLYERDGKGDFVTLHYLCCAPSSVCVLVEGGRGRM